MSTGSQDRDYYKSSFSVQGSCVEVAFTETGEVFVRDSKASGGPELRFNESEWRAFTAGVHNREFEFPAS